MSKRICIKEKAMYYRCWNANVKDIGETEEVHVAPIIEKAYFLELV